MEILKFEQFNEAIIDYESKSNDEFIDELNLIRGGIEFKKLQEIGEKYGIEIVDYDTFYEELPDENEKNCAPPFRFGMPVVLVNPVTIKPRIVLGERSIRPDEKIRLDRRNIEHFKHTLKHETIHTKQISKMKKYVNPTMSPGDDAYFKDKQEVMALSQSITDMIINKPTLDPFGRKERQVRTMAGAMKDLKYNPLYNDIKRKVDRKTLGRYKKYIYLYLKKELEKEKK